MVEKLMPFIVCTPVSHLPAGMVWSVVVGVYVCAPFVVSVKLVDDVPPKVNPAACVCDMETNPLELVGPERVGASCAWIGNAITAPSPVDASK